MLPPVETSNQNCSDMISFDPALKYSKVSPFLFPGFEGQGQQNESIVSLCNFDLSIGTCTSSNCFCPPDVPKLSENSVFPGPLIEIWSELCVCQKRGLVAPMPEVGTTRPNGGL